MSVFFTVLLWLSLFLLIWGVIAPADFSHYLGKFFTRTRVAAIFGTLSIALFLLGSITAPEKSSPFTFVLKPHSSTSVASAQDTSGRPGPNAKITKQTVTETETIPYGVSAIQDPSLPAGVEKLSAMGVVGQRVITYQLTYADGVQIDKQMLSKVVSRQPVNQVTLVGGAAGSASTTTSKPSIVSTACDSNYSGVCVPIAPNGSDVDCYGRGNGPLYIKGIFQVVGDDIYHLDRDEDGTACNEWD